MEKFKNKQIAILWFWREWKSTFNFLKNKWIQNITILDERELDNFTSEEKEIIGNANFILGKNYLNSLEKFDIIIKSPWVSPYKNELINYREKLIDQAQIFFNEFNWKIIAITWTKGKTTITALVYELLKNAWFNVWIVWNIGKPALDYIEENYDFVVFEMSSFMLELADINPYISVFNNIFPEHLDYHKTFENYKNAKLNIIWKDSFIVYNTQYLDLFEKFKNDKISFWINWDYSFDWDNFLNNWNILYNKNNLKLIWEHNLNNICVVNAVAGIMNISPDILEKTIKNFKWVKHRLENVWTKNWIIFYDDAISTTPQSTIAAIRALGKDLETIFLGWKDRWCYDFKELARVIFDNNISNIVFFPETWKNIQEELKRINFELFTKLNILETNTMKDAVEFAFKNTWIDKICLLSCASPSFSLWKNYEEKWEDFKKCINYFC